MLASESYSSTRCACRSVDFVTRSSIALTEIPMHFAARSIRISFSAMPTTRLIALPELALVEQRQPLGRAALLVRQLLQLPGQRIHRLRHQVTDHRLHGCRSHRTSKCRLDKIIRIFQKAKNRSSGRRMGYNADLHVLAGQAFYDRADMRRPAFAPYAFRVGLETCLLVLIEPEVKRLIGKMIGEKRHLFFRRLAGRADHAADSCIDDRWPHRSHPRTRSCRGTRPGPNG